MCEWMIHNRTLTIFSSSNMIICSILSLVKDPWFLSGDGNTNKPFLSQFHSILIWYNFKDIRFANIQEFLGT